MAASRRSPARWAAPAALLVVALAVAGIVRGGTNDGAGDGATTAARTTPPTPGRTATTTTPRGSGGGSQGQRRTYTVRPGDTLSAIAQRTGLSVERLTELNPEVDSQALRVGQRLRISGEPAS